MTKAQLQALLNEMTLEEKIGQLLQLAPAFFEGADSAGQITGPLLGMGINEETIYRSGSVLGLGSAKEAIAIQEAHMRNHRLAIPLLIMADVIHGYGTIFPVPLALSCSWDLELAKETAAIAAKEAAVSGIHITFSPMADLSRDPRWGRVMESFGEDPWLNGKFAAALVRGYQGDDFTKEPYKLAACIKHFAAYGAGEGGRDYNTVDISEWMKREFYLPAYKEALNAGCEMVMTAFNTVDGVPATGNKRLMRQLLREEWGFDRVIISDWGAVKEMIAHGVAEDERECARKAIEAGVDIEMMSPCYTHHLKELVEAGEVESARIDEAVMRILELKQKLGLFDNMHRFADATLEMNMVGSKQHRQVAYKSALKSCVLLQNNHKALPLQKEERIALLGPFATSNDILGPWSCMGRPEEAVTVCDGMKTWQAQTGQGSLTTVGCSVENISDEQISAMISVAKTADTIVLALGESSEMSGEAGSRANINLPESQLRLLGEIHKLNKKIIVILFNGRPLDLHEVLSKSDAVLEAWFSGTEGGNAITALLYGEGNPSGRLTMSFPYAVGQIPVYYNHFNTGRPQNAPDAQVRYVSQYLDIPNEPLFPFGYGLSYSDIEYGEIALSSAELCAGEELQLTVQITNRSAIAGEETVQLYVRDMAGETVRPVSELKDYQKIMLAGNESKQVIFTITEEMLRYHHSDLQYSSDPGRFVAMVGPNSRDTEKIMFSLK